jgi:hypothetical protein
MAKWQLGRGYIRALTLRIKRAGVGGGAVNQWIVVLGPNVAVCGSCSPLLRDSADSTTPSLALLRRIAPRVCAWERSEMSECLRVWYLEKTIIRHFQRSSNRTACML